MTEERYFYKSLAQIAVLKVAFFSSILEKNQQSIRDKGNLLPKCETLHRLSCPGENRATEIRASVTYNFHRVKCDTKTLQQGQAVLCQRRHKQGRKSHTHREVGTESDRSKFIVKKTAALPNILT